MWKLSYPQNHNGATPCLPSPKVGNAHFKTSFVVPGAAEGLHYGPSSVIGAKGRRCSCNCYIKKKRKIVQYDSHFSRTPLVISPLVAIRLSGLSTWFIWGPLGEGRNWMIVSRKRPLRESPTRVRSKSASATGRACLRGLVFLVLCVHFPQISSQSVAVRLGMLPSIDKIAVSRLLYIMLLFPH